MNTTIAIILILLSILILLYLLFKRIEIMVCNEVCIIFCNAIMYIDQLCEINNKIKTFWSKFYQNTISSGKSSFGIEKKMKDELFLFKKEIEQLVKIEMTFKPSAIKSIILHKHKLNTQEMQVSLVVAESMKKDLLMNLDSLVNIVKAEYIMPANWILSESNFKCFQHKANVFFFSALEGLCSFPLRSLETYNQQSHQIHYLPMGIGLNKRKEDYLQLQDIELQKIRDLVDEARMYADKDVNEIDFTENRLLMKEINVFFAGSKDLQIERDIYSNIINQLQTKWKDKNINIFGYSFQNFEHEVVIGGHQCTSYNEFIKRYTDIIIFVLNGDVGGVTIEEFDLAMSIFKTKGSPAIFVYSKVSDDYNEKIEAIRRRVNEESQYWQDYFDNNQLRLMIQIDLSEQMQKVFEMIVEEKKAFE